MRFFSTRLALLAAAFAGQALAEPLRFQLQYKPRDAATPGASSRFGGQFETLSGGLDAKKPAIGEFVDYEFDAVGNMMGASVAVENLQSLNPRLWAYFASVAFKGNQVVDVLIDTGSAGLGVPVAVPQNWTGKDFQMMDPKTAGATRIPCNDQRCRGHCDSPAGKHFCSPYGGSCEHFQGEDVCTFAWLYGDGSSAQGVLLSSQIDLGGAWVTSTYGGIVKATDTFFEAPRGGGIMGLSFGNYSLCDDEFSCFPPLLDDLVAQMNYQDKFAICANGPDAVMILGGGDNSLHEGAVQYVQLQPPFSFYWVVVTDVSMNGQSIVPTPSFPRLRAAAGIPDNSNGKLLALVDTGNSAMYLPESIYDNFKEQVRGALRSFPSLIDRERSIFTGYAMYIAPEVLARMPPLTLTLENGVTFNLSAEQYTTEFKAPDIPVPLRALKVIRGKRFVLGQTVLNHMYIEIDRAAKTIGFAPSKPGCKATVG